jgi:uncharacterized repeat protein (TIGR03803 family)
LKVAPSSRRYARVILASLPLLIGALQAHGEDTYDGAAELQISTLGIGSATYSNVVLTINLPPVRAPSGSSPGGAVDTYDPATNELFVPAVKVGSTTYYNAVVTVNHLTSIGSVSGADTFDGTDLVLRNVQVGAQSYHDVTLRVGLANITRLGNGMPSVSVDQYDAKSGQLSVGAVQVGARVYTNVILNITLSNLVSVAGYAERVLYSFQGNADGNDPVAGLAIDAAGSLFGTTSGIASSTGGTVFKLTPDGNGGYTETVLYNFTNGADGGNPLGGVVLDAAGNLYGTTASGGSASSGTVFKLASDGNGGYTQSVLHSFTAGTDGSYPHAGVVLDASGNLFGTTQFGGSATMGTVFRLMPGGEGGYSESVLYNFLGRPDGNNPQAGLILDANGALYGTTFSGGTAYGGTAFKLSPNGGGYTEAVLYNFTAGADGGDPQAGLVLDSGGNLFGTTSNGGTVSGGTVYKLTPNGSGGYTESVLHNFGIGVFEDGEHPLSALILDAGGNLYGTASTGGSGGRGTAFELTQNGSGVYAESLLYNFPGSPDGNEPEASLIMDASGNLYGTTASGGPAHSGSSYGVVFEIH